MLRLSLLVDLVGLGRATIVHILIHHFQMTALQSDVLGSDLGAEPHHFLDIELNALEILLQLVAQLAEVMPGIGHLEEQLGLLAACSALIYHLLASFYQRAGLLLVLCLSGSLRL